MVRELTEKERKEMMKEFLHTIKSTHHSFLSFMWGEFGLRRKPRATVIVPVAGEESGLVIQNRRITIATGEVDSSLRDDIEYKKWIFEAAYHTAHESGHYLHAFANPKVMSKKWVARYERKKDEWVLDEVVADMSSIIYLGELGKKREARRFVENDKLRRIALGVYEEDKDLLPFLVTMDAREARDVIENYTGRN